MTISRIKMQVDYDLSYLKEEEEAQRKIKTRNKMIANHKLAIVDVEMTDAGDFEALTTLYRKIFKFLLDFAPNAKNADRVIEREVAAALESVFPRVGLKAFIELNYDQKTTQLLELARIILGIRLFNREEGRGGAGLDKMDSDSKLLANVLVQDINREVDFFADACSKYQKAIIKAHNEKRRRLHEEELQSQIKADHPKEVKSEEFNDSSSKVKNSFLLINNNLVSDYLIDRWSQELANRRQYLSFLKVLQEEMTQFKMKINQIYEKIQMELSNIKAMVSDKNSVPKEMVYPRFDSVGTLWLQLYEEMVTMIARSNTFQTLCKYRLSFTPTLNENHYLDGSVKEVSLIDDNGIQLDITSNEVGGDRQAFFSESKNSISDTEAKADEKEGPIGSNGAVLLSVLDTPDFMLLPLEFQGYCPWTIVEARGLLIPGKPIHGIVRYQNLYYVFDHPIAIKLFMKNPEHYLKEIKMRAIRSPEYIHLLRLQRWFPSASIAKFLQNHFYEMQNKGQPLSKDASTSTPVHFIDSYIDVNYHWNEWELRKRALKIVNLRNCSTKSQQTDESNFKRDNDTQVYLPRTNETQTRRDKGTNPPTVTTYIAGLRGKVREEGKHEELTTITSSIKKSAIDSKPNGIVNPKVGIVTLKLDL